MAFTEAQLKTLSAMRDHEVTITYGGMQTGKTTVANAVIGARGLALGERLANSTGLIIANSIITAWDNIFAPMQDPDIYGEQIANSIRGHRGASEVWVGKTRYILKGANNKASAHKIRGIKAHTIYFDEISTLNEEAFQTAITRSSVPGAIFLGTTNPGPPNHWFKKNYLDRIGDDGFLEGEDPKTARRWYAQRYELTDNTFLPPEYRATMEGFKEINPTFYMRNIKGYWVAAEGAVYPQFSPSTHVVEPMNLPYMDRIIAIGIDAGMTDPTAAVLVGLGPSIDDPSQNAIYVLSEFNHHDIPNSDNFTQHDIALHLQAWMHENQKIWYPPEHIYYDHAGAYLKQELYRLGIQAYGAKKEVIPGIATVQSLVGNKQLYVSANCKHLIEEFSSYGWKEQDNGLSEKPQDGDDHCLDALRYALHSSKYTWQNDIEYIGV